MGVYDTVMNQKIKRQVVNRIKKIAGQISSLHKMIDEEKYCVDVITQSSAIRNALSSVENLMLENHLSEHVVRQMKSNQEKKAVDEVIKVFKLAKKK